MPSTSKNHVADVCLYGASHCGFGWIAQTRDGQVVGDGDVRGNCTASTALTIARCEVTAALGGDAGDVRVFAPGGRVMAWAPLRVAGYYGDLKWEPAPQYVISVEEIERAAAAQAVAGIR